MIVRHFLLNVNEANAFVAHCTRSGEALIIDAGSYDEALVEYVVSTGLNVKYIFITHDHFDHVDGVAAYVDRFSATVLAGLPSVGGCKAQLLQHGDTVAVGNESGRVLATPGHKPESLSLAFPGHAFTGDALFAGSVGGTGSAEDYDTQIEAIRKHLFTLPGDTLLYTGHGPVTTVAVESRYNPFFA
jgi:glyoxylase-like metal-dependent hydrolase (beta-lactamase superfamily II)